MHSKPIAAWPGDFLKQDFASGAIVTLKNIPYQEWIRRLADQPDDNNFRGLVESLVLEFMPRLQKFTRRKLGDYADDWQSALCEAILKVANRVKSGQYDLTRLPEFPSYLMKAVQNKCYDYCNEFNRGPKIYSVSKLPDAAVEAIHELKIERQQRLEILKGCLSHLPEVHRHVLEFFYFREKGSEEIVRILALDSRQKFYNIKSYALTLMQNCLKGRRIESI